MHFIFSIEGNIGSGKSTLVDILKNFSPSIKLDHFEIVYLEEPVDEWHKIKNENGVGILEEFYGNPKKWAFSFQMMAYISRIAILKKTIKKNPHCIIISERSVYTDKNVFAKMLYDEKNISEIDYQIYKKWFDEFVKDLRISGLIYVNTSPEKCLERVNKRNRQGENIPIEYLTKCGNYHNEWIETHPNVLTLNGDIDFNEKQTSTILKKWVNNIVKFIDNTESVKEQSNMFKLSENEIMNVLC
jgi:deoxyadenosine/deoxycytidine kinase